MNLLLLELPRWFVSGTPKTRHPPAISPPIIHGSPLNMALKKVLVILEPGILLSQVENLRSQAMHYARYLPHDIKVPFCPLYRCGIVVGMIRFAFSNLRKLEWEVERVTVVYGIPEVQKVLQ